MRGHRSTDETSTVAYEWRSDQRPVLSKTWLRRRPDVGDRRLEGICDAATFCHGFPGSMNAASIAAVWSHLRIAVATNSGPLSERMYREAPRTLGGSYRLNESILPASQHLTRRR